MDFLRNPSSLHILTTVLPISTRLALRSLKHIVLTLIDRLGLEKYDDILYLLPTLVSRITDPVCLLVSLSGQIIKRNWLY